MPFRASISMLALLVSPCAASAADIEFWYGNIGTAEKAIVAACGAFNAAQQAHSVTCVGQGGYEPTMQKAIAAYRSGKHPVLIQFFDAGTLDLMLSDAVVPVEQAMPEVNWKDYLAGARSFYATSKGELYSQPYNGTTLVFYGNAELLAKARIDKLPETYEELAAVARKLKDAGVECPITTDGHPWRVLEQVAARHSVPIASRHNGYDGLDAEYTFNRGLIAEHLENLLRWRQEGLVKLDQDTRTGKYTAAFNSGECALMEASSGLYVDAFKALGDKVMVAQAPMYEGHKRYNTLIGGASIWLMKGHDEDRIEAARAFLDFIRRDDQQIEFTRATGNLPVTRSALELLQSSDKTRETEFATVDAGVRSLSAESTDDSRGIRLGFYMQFREIFQEETQKAFAGDQSMSQALDLAVARGNELLRRFEKTYSNVTLP
ncbi:sn-glycerol-3-phosphate ABC transporter substrate-binding protein UgpB 1 (plasmid) [Rhizobium etli 8C-3]|uniref:sn-glycerol-3-phosphate-binding periplasmic protein UgpB n=1 Tax=Rhizobium etli 8C-3 TaxID=538025 RepID=A0A1L5PAR7_RHIET|nr:extracellular solute-binding protein [Rhizobium etli]APO77202.1 sn-glycerol-3-phosphate ABC transporter substrate-binding protein UgpB 1 [Rhizobium etli 8C-3]